MTLEQPAPPASPPLAAALDDRHVLERGHLFGSPLCGSRPLSVL
jgi:hypothetical protein